MVTLTDASGNERTLAGIVTYQRERGLNAKKQSRVEVKLQPRLCLLTRTTDNRVIQALSIPDIVTRVLAEHGINTDAALWHLNKTYPARQYTVQFNETDLAFVERLLASIGVSYWFTVKDGRDILNLTDDNAKFTALDLGPIPFIADAGPFVLDKATAKPMACFNQFIKGLRQVTAHARVVDYNYATPENVINAGMATSLNDPTFVHYGTGTAHHDEAELRARLIDERYAVEGLDIQIKGSVAGLHPGATFSFVHPDYPRYSGDYLVMSMSHRLIQQAATEHDGDLGNLAYTQHAHLIPQSTPFRPELKPGPAMPAVYTARIESNGQYALLDEHGRFKVRHLFDTGAAAHTEASLPLRSLSFHGGPASANTVGAVFPFRDDVEVLWSCVDGNPNQPVIIGTLPNPATQSPITSRNFGDNIIRTGGKNELLFHEPASGSAR